MPSWPRSHLLSVGLSLYLAVTRLEPRFLECDLLGENLVAEFGRVILDQAGVGYLRPVNTVEIFNGFPATAFLALRIGARLDDEQIKSA